MRRPPFLIVILALILVTALTLGIRADRFPLGVPGEWLWSRLPVVPTAWDWMIGLAALAAYAGFAGSGALALARRSSRLREGSWVVALVLMAVIAQVGLQSAAPAGYGLTKWVTLALPGSSGYADVARDQMRDPWRFWADYPDWIKRQDSLHIGTHPPGLFLWSRFALGLMEAHPGLAQAIVDHLPSTVAAGFRSIPGRPLPRAERAALALTGLMALLACSATVVPLYLLARQSQSASESWAAAVIWPLVPAAILFQPTADTAFPLLATSALALAVWGRSIVAGVILAVGMFLTLAFLPVGLIVSLLHATVPKRDVRQRLGRIGLTGLGFLVPTLALWALSRANPFMIWYWNQRHHARFYAEYPKSYLSWVVANPIELAIALGLPATLWALIGFAGRRAPRTSWLTLAVLVILNFSGRNLSEVARLWLPLMPPLLLATASGFSLFEAGPKTIAATAALIALQTLALQALIQVVYPF